MSYERSLLSYIFNSLIVDDKGGLGGVKSGATEVVVNKGTIENIKIDFGSTQLLSLLGRTTLSVYDKVTAKLVAATGSSTLVDIIALLPNGNSLSLQGLKEGTYTIQSVTTKGIVYVNATITRSVIDLDSFTIQKGTGQT